MCQGTLSLILSVFTQGEKPILVNKQLASLNPFMLRKSNHTPLGRRSL